jgi:lon-related putative ATP-dependent protease
MTAPKKSKKRTRRKIAAAQAAPGAVHVPLPASALRRRCDAKSLGFRTTAELEPSSESFGHARAVEAIRFALRMSRPGYNIFALGPSGVGKHAIVRRLLEEWGRDRPTPPDWLYVENFARPAEPRALSVPAGLGSRLEADMKQLVEDLSTAIPEAFETREYATRLQEIQEEFQKKHEALFAEIEATGRQRGIAVLRSPEGVVFAPAEGDSVIAPADFEKLPEARKAELRNTVRELQGELADRVKELPRIHRELRERIRGLDRNVTRYAVDNAIEETVQRYAALPEVGRYLDDVRADVIERAADFRREKSEDGAAALGFRASRRLDRYSVNVLVDHGASHGAPVVYDDHATYESLVGRIEHYGEFGNLVTNFLLVKSGTIHRASGGYLLIDAGKLLGQPYAWDGLKRTLFRGHVQPEPLSHLLGLSSVESIQPQAIPIDVKVVVFGTREVFYLLTEHDPEFLELFKVEADFEESTPRTPESERELSHMLATLARSRNLRPLAAEAVALLVDEASRLAGDSRRLSTSVRQLFDLSQEADHYAERREGSVIAADDVRTAAEAQTRQRDRFRVRLLEQVTERTILIDVAGRRVGQVNGLAALSVGEFTFGHPARITATAHIGDGRVIDIEREVELGGPLHSKGVLILSNYLAERYAKRYPLSLSASLVFEQSYSGVEGDSASLAELCALLSALAEVPVKQSIAITGSINQWGHVQAIGAVNEKVEGFYDTCRALGLDGAQGVILPRANVEHLMLREDVADAAARGALHLYPVDTVDAAMEILTDLPSGSPGDDGSSPPGTFNQLVEQQLMEFAVVAKRFGELVQIEEGPRARRRGAQKKRPVARRR